MTGKSTSLTEFAKTRGRASKDAWIDSLPPEIYQECVDGWKAGLRASPITAWLKSLGYDASDGKVAAFKARAGE